jgi:enoyl-CoA hydratase/carnithine racemase
VSELKRLGQGIEQSELNRLKARIKSSLIMQQESTSARSGALARDWYHLGRVRTLDEVGAMVDALSAESSERARFSLAFARLGLSLDFGTSWVLQRRMGLHQAKRIAFTGEIISAPRAMELGFVNEVVTVGELDDAVAAIAAQIAKGPPLAISMTKRMLDNSVNASLVQALEAETVAQSVNLGTTDLREALQAFAEKRPPIFHGR